MEYQIIYTLTEFNRYRRGKYKTYRDFELTTGVTPKKIGAAIDSAVQVIKDLKKENLKLKQAIADTLEENRHLADGDNCTLIRLKRALQ